MEAISSTRPIDAAIAGTPRGRFLLELFSNSAVFPVANILLELLLEGGARYFADPDFYAIVIAALAQAAWLARAGEGAAWRRIAGNLVGPAIYTAIEVALEGMRFFGSPHHLAYWGFGLAIGVLQGARAGRAGALADALLIVESVVRSMILFAMYAIFETLTMPAGDSHARFFDDPSHVFIAWAIALLGLVGGIAATTSQRYLLLLRGVSQRLRLYSEWFFGRSLLDEAVADPQRLALRRRDRAILFIDVRGFTAWSETQSPEAVVALLDDYYREAEAVFARHAPIRHKFAADEIMAVFADARVALHAASDLARVVVDPLGARGLGAGIGLHWGPVVEGLMGGAQIKYFDFIGDTVNTAKRIEGAAVGGEILMSGAFRAAAGEAAGAVRSIEAKGKSGRLEVHAWPAPEQRPE